MDRTYRAVQVVLVVLTVIVAAAAAAILIPRIAGTRPPSATTAGKTDTVPASELTRADPVTTTGGGERPDTDASVKTETTAKPATEPSSAVTEKTEPVTQTTVTADDPETRDEPEDQLISAAEERLASMPLFEKVCQLFIVTPEGLTGGSRITSVNAKFKTALREYPVAGLIFYGVNLQTPEQTAALLSACRNYGADVEGLPLFLAVDEEGGSVARIGGNPAFGVPTVPAMGKISDGPAAYDAGATIGGYLKDLGFNLDFAPVADVIIESSNKVIGNRSFGKDPVLVSTLAWQVAKGLRDSGVLATYKHFPGHGSTAGDTHDGFAASYRTLEELRQAELVPFADGAERGVDLIMVAHISLPNVIGDSTPASLSRAIVTDLLRDEMGYGGLIVTDALSMGAIANTYTAEESAVMAVKAGCDLLLAPDDLETAVSAVLKAVESGEISEEQIDASVLRILIAKLKMGD